MPSLPHNPTLAPNRLARLARALVVLSAVCGLPTLLKAQLPVTEKVTVTDTVSFPDALHSETVTTTDAAIVTPLIAVTAPVVFYSAASLGFGSVTAGQTATQSLQVSAIGEGPLTLSSAAITSGTAFTVGSISCTNGATSLPTTLPAGGACTFTISYLAPADGSTPSGTLTFTDNAGLSNVARVQVGSSFTQSIGLNGSGSSTAPPPPPPAVVTVPVGETITVTDTPSFLDALDAETIITKDSVTLVPVIAVAAPVVFYSEASLGFSGQSGTQAIAVSDIGQAPLTLASATISGSPHFAITQIACTNGAISPPVIIPAGGVCSFTISYTASATPANDNATLVFTDNAALSNLQTVTSGSNYMQSVPLNGSGATIAAPPPPPATVQVLDNEPIKVTDTSSFPDAFDPEPVHVTDAVFVTPLIQVGAPVASYSAGGLGFSGQSGTQTIAVSDIGQAPLTLASATISGSQRFAITQIACTNGAISPPVIIPAGGVCTFTITYTVSATPANDNAALVFTDNAALSNLPTTSSGSSYMQSVPLSGSGTTIAPPPPPPATVQVLDNEPIRVTDTPSFPDAFDPEPIKVTDTVVVTVYNTSVGSATVTPVDTTTGQSPVTVTFSNVAVPGNTTLTTSSGSGSAPPAGFQLGIPPVIFDISTTAKFTGSATVCINYTGITFTGSPRLFHYENGTWVDHTVSLDTVNHIVCASVTSFSPFAVFSHGVPLTITANNASRQYGAADPAFTVFYSSNGAPVTPDPTQLSGTLICTSTDTTLSAGGTSYPITCSGLTSNSYNITYVPGTLSITRAPLIVTASSAARPYGANNPPFSVTLAGLQNGDVYSTIYSTTATPQSPVGTYPVTPSVAQSSTSLQQNYAITIVPGTLTVFQEPTTLTLSLAPSSIMVGLSSVATLTLTAPDMVIPIDPSVLTPFLLTSPLGSDILANGGMCTPVPAATPGLASCTIGITSVEPNGRNLNAVFSGTLDLGPSADTKELMVTASLLSQQVCIHSEFRNVAVPGGSTLWFNSIFRVRDVTKQLINISFFNSTVQFQYTDPSGNVVTVNQAMPDAHIVIDPTATAATTSFDAVNNVWLTTIPFDLDDNAFLTGLPWLVPSAGLPGDVEPVSWCGTFASDVADIDIGWRWAAASYSSFGNGNSTLGVKPMNTDHDNLGTNHDRAGTPENFKQFLVPGARGKGGTNYTGTYSASKEIE